ncbi:MAG TPA: sigma-54-dependent Fis family transcriptional regulator [Planctomycetes bacterium]|nr:sigma-54-dependent Fis family transcriptional regulator [Planctomycetota bacterium]
MLRSVPFLGSSAPLRAFLEQLEAAAASDVTVLLTGESGTGKTTAARLLHGAGSRAEAPFVLAPLAELTPSLVEAALFGHERGAFTDAHHSRRGWFARADGGTIVLDDVDLLPVQLQGKLLRTLQERVIEPLGAETPVAVDVRVVATTNADLRARVAAGEFREDLYYRLGVVPIEVPPLRARGPDLPELAAALEERVAERLRVAPRGLGPSALERLAAHPWPGNIRELENALERVTVLARPSASGEIAPEEFDFLEEAVAGIADRLADEALANGITLEVLEQALLERSYREHRGNVSAAARAVGLTRRAFEYRRTKGESGNP